MSSAWPHHCDRRVVRVSPPRRAAHYRAGQSEGGDDRQSHGDGDGSSVNHGLRHREACCSRGALQLPRLLSSRGQTRAVHDLLGVAWRFWRCARGGGSAAHVLHAGGRSNGNAARSPGPVAAWPSLDVFANLRLIDACGPLLSCAWSSFFQPLAPSEHFSVAETTAVLYIICYSHTTSRPGPSDIIQRNPQPTQAGRNGQLMLRNGSISDEISMASSHRLAKQTPRPLRPLATASAESLASYTAPTFSF